ncbi:MAG: hypothetical protein E7526_01440 [Ruminococcaceae bacterium]|nr:hypothetical protein [Oscillospiraceae bacterium]
MRKKKTIDVTGVPLTPSWHGRKCLGNGENPDYDCLCDECNYYLYCFPEFNWQIKKSRFKRRLKKLFKK